MTFFFYNSVGNLKIAVNDKNKLYLFNHGNDMPCGFNLSDPHAMWTQTRSTCNQNSILGF